MVLGAMIVGGMVGNYAARRQFESMSAAQAAAVTDRPGSSTSSSGNTSSSGSTSASRSVRKPSSRV